MRRLVILVLALVPLASLAAACGGQPPSQQHLLVDAAKTVAQAKSVRLDGRLTLTATGDGDRQTASARLRGGLSHEAVSLRGSGSVGSNGVQGTVPFALRLTSDTFYVMLLGDWYSSSVSDLTEQAKHEAGAAAGGKDKSLLEKLRMLRSARDIAAHAFTGAVSEGPELAGDETWQWRGTVSPRGALAMVAKYGKDARTTPSQRAKARRVLEQLAQVATVTVVAGKDGKPCRLVVTVDASQPQVAALAKATGEKLGDKVSELHARLRVDLSHWNEPVRATAPASAKPFEELLSSFLGN